MNEKPDISPPKILLHFLRWFCDPGLLEDVEGDLLELFNNRSQLNERKAKFLFAIDVILLFRPGIIRGFKLGFNNYFMFRKLNIRSSITCFIKLKV